MASSFAPASVQYDAHSNPWPSQIAPAAVAVNINPYSLLEDQRRGKRRGRIRTKVAASCKEVGSPPQLSEKTDITDEGVDKAQVESGAEDHIMVGTDADLEPGEWDRAGQITVMPEGSHDTRPSSSDGVRWWKDASWCTPTKAKRKWYKRSWNTGPRWGHSWYNCSSCMEAKRIHQARH